MATATSALKLVIDDREYEASLKHAKQGMMDLQQSLQAAGKSFTQVDEKIVEYARALGNMEGTAKGSKGQLRELSQTLTDVTIVYRQMTDEEKASPFGQALLKSIDKLTQRASVIEDTMNDVKQSIKNAASDTRTFDQLAQGMSVATAGFQGLTGASKLLGIEMGNDVQVIAKLQAAMAVTNSLTTIQTALQQESALMQGIAALKAKAAAIAQDMLAKNTGKATVAQKAFNAVAKANPYVLLASAIAAVGTALVAFSSGADDAATSQDRLNNVLDKALNKVREINRQYEIMNGYINAIGGEGDMEKLSRQRENINQQLAELEARKTQLENMPRTPGDGGERTTFGKVADFFSFGIASTVFQGALTEMPKEYTEALNEVNKQINELKGKRDELDKSMISLGKAYMTFENEWQTMTDPRKIRAAISHYQDKIKNLPKTDEYDRLAAEYQRRVDSLQQRLREPATNRGGGGGGGSNNTPDIKVDEIFPEGSVKQLHQQMQKLQEAQGLVTNTSSWRELQQQIDAVTNRVSILKGELPKDKVFSLQFENADGLQGVLDQLKAINGVTIDEKTLTVTADTSEAMRQVQQLTENIEGTTVELKVKPVELAVGISGTSMNSISEFVSALQQQLQDIDMSEVGGPDKYKEIATNLIDAQTLANVLKTAIEQGVDMAKAGIDIEGLFNDILSNIDIDDDAWKKIIEKFNEQLKAQGIELNIDTKTGNVSSKKTEANTTAKAIEKFNSDYSKLTGGVSSIVSGIQSMGVEIPKGIQSVLGVLTGISSIMSGIASILTVIQVATSISAAKPFANGGVIHAAGGWSGFVPGNSFSGDNIPALLNSGELVLNRFQQQALAGTLENSGKNISISGSLRGEDIVLVADRWGKRTGKGELAFWK